MQLVCWFTVIAPHLPDLGTPAVTVRRRLGLGGALVVSLLIVLVLVVLGAATTGGLVELVEL